MAVTGQELPRIEEAAAGKAGSRRGLERAWGGLWRPLLRFWHSIQRFIALTIFSSLTRRIVVLNLAGLAVGNACVIEFDSHGFGTCRVRPARVKFP